MWDLDDGIVLTFWGLVMHICASVNWISIGSGNGLAPSWCQAITWTSADLFSIGSFQIYYNEISTKIQTVFQENGF